jgi:hypothetical protein
MVSCYPTRSQFIAKCYMINELRKASGKITSPKSGSKIVRSIHVEGELFDLPLNNCHIWLAVEVHYGMITRLWPKTGELPLTEGKWSHRVEEHGSPPQAGFSLVLLQVNDDVHRLIENLRRYSKMTGSYPGLQWFNLTIDNEAGVHVLDRVDNLHLR